ncbi:universal stress protein [Piscinibacter terrae]|uniref:Universal stress protein n=1 Tax=Piscinibacter terrae TaxID=2496871 RepID=A0A3N7HRN1_9BURK|nr:universal stress protein [Albitalea terrae]RQP24920.1 universal stress protein [Albitalea terrae]
MGCLSLLVHLDHDPHCDARVALAARLAARLDAHVVGLATVGTLELDGPFAASRAVHDAATARDAAAIRAAHSIDRFQTLCRSQHVASFDAEAVEGDSAQALLHHAHTADLTVISQARHLRDERHFVERVLMHNARPTLVVPRDCPPEGSARRILIAWDDSAGCARAVADAMPWLQAADEVALRIWRRSGEPGEAAIRHRLEGVAAWLARRGVKTQARVAEATHAIGAEILAAAARLHSELVVMGTYGHSRWTERIVGGATRTALSHAKVPLLMSH